MNAKQLARAIITMKMAKEFIEELNDYEWGEFLVSELDQVSKDLLDELANVGVEVVVTQSGEIRTRRKKL